MLRDSDGLTRSMRRKYKRNPNLTLVMRKMTTVMSCVKQDSLSFNVFFLVRVNETSGARIFTSITSCGNSGTSAWGC